MKRLFRWGVTVLMVLAMFLVFGGGCAPAADPDEGGDAEFEDWEDYIDDLDLDLDEDMGDEEADLENSVDLEDEEAEDGVDVE